MSAISYPEPHTPNHIEIMAPAGSFESLMAAIQGGADSVYFGVGNLNMRSKSANNFSVTDLSEISRICKEHNVRTYLTLNIVIYDDELEYMKSVIDEAIKQNITAVIAADLSVVQYAHSKGLEVHISTQCNITNIEAVKFFAQYADVMVTARELSLKQVKSIAKAIEAQNIRGPKGNLVEIEVFAHGALCMAVSGKCYLSLDNYNFSANRGACLQLCRRPYQVFDTDGKVELAIDNKYIMSPKDLKTIDFMDKIIDAGVKVLKIEGRGRSADYVKTVTSVYKEASVAIIEGTFSQEKLAFWNEKLKTVYNRGFWDGYYLGRTMGEWTEAYGSQAIKRKVYVGKITNYFQKVKAAEITMETGNLSAGDELLITGDTTGVMELTLKEMRMDNKNVDSVTKGDVFSIPAELLRRGDKVYKMILSEE